VIQYAESHRVFSLALLQCAILSLLLVPVSIIYS
jgi:hypothetical protein